MGHKGAAPEQYWPLLQHHSAADVLCIRTPHHLAHINTIVVSLSLADTTVVAVA